MEQKKTKKGTAPPRYDDAFKAGAVRLVTEQGRQPVEVAKELGICIDTADRTGSKSASGSWKRRTAACAGSWARKTRS